MVWMTELFCKNQNEKLSLSLIKFHCVYFGSLFRQTISCFCQAAYYSYFFILCPATFMYCQVFHIIERFLTEQVPDKDQWLLVLCTSLVCLGSVIQCFLDTVLFPAVPLPGGRSSSPNLFMLPWKTLLKALLKDSLPLGQYGQFWYPFKREKMYKMMFVWRGLFHMNLCWLLEITTSFLKRLESNSSITQVRVCWRPKVNSTVPTFQNLPSPPLTTRTVAHH